MEEKAEMTEKKIRLKRAKKLADKEREESKKKKKRENMMRKREPNFFTKEEINEINRDSSLLKRRKRGELNDEAFLELFDKI